MPAFLFQLSCKGDWTFMTNKLTKRLVHDKRDIQRMNNAQFDGVLKGAGICKLHFSCVMPNYVVQDVAKMLE